MQYQVIHLKDLYPFLGENGKDPVLSVYAADNLREMKRDNQKHPAILVCPGGGYSMVSAREGEPIALNLLPWGYHVFVLEYSCAPHCFPSQMREVAAAMELIHANADVWHTDVQRIAIMGFSAGGHLACHYTNCYDIEEVRAVFPDSKPVKACILGYPVITALPGHRHEATFLNLSGHEAIASEDIENFSLENKVTDKTPPTFLWHTSDDDCVPVSNCLFYAQALAKHNIFFALHVYPFGKHGLSTADDMTCPPLDRSVHPVRNWLRDLKDWLKTVL